MHKILKTIGKTLILLLIIMLSQAGKAFALTPASSTALVSAARQQIGITVIYDPAYVKLAYPGGDVSAERGVCTDVLIRAARVALHYDLQQLIHQDMRRHFSAYPQRWGLKKPDRNIDHRRVPNLQIWFNRFALAMRPGTDPQAFRPADIVTCLLPGNLPHIMLVSDRTSAGGTPLVIHNIGQGTREEDMLFTFPLTGHYRFK